MKSVAKDLSKQRIGSLVVQERGVTPPGSKRAYWLCKCDCGNMTTVMGKHLRKKAIKSCGCLRNNPSPRFKGYEKISGGYWASVKYKASERKIEFDLDIKDAWAIFEEQKEKCALSGLPLEFVRWYKKDRTKQTASLDRKDSSKGYTKDNVQWVHKDINIMKNVYSTDDFINYCKLVVEHATA